ncbi:MAG: hypothetical protein RIF41_11560 [Polyangiaceae bacterium]
MAAAARKEIISMSFDAAVVREQGVSFAVIVVRSGVVGVPSRREEVAAGFRTKFPDLPIILMSQDSRGRPTFWGRTDIVRFLSRIAVHRLPWRRYR